MCATLLAWLLPPAKASSDDLNFVVVLITSPGENRVHWCCCCKMLQHKSPNTRPRTLEKEMGRNYTMNNVMNALERERHDCRFGLNLLCPGFCCSPAQETLLPPPPVHHSTLSRVLVTTPTSTAPTHPHTPLAHPLVCTCNGQLVLWPHSRHPAC